MGIFSRRILKRILWQNADLLSKAQLREQLERLNGSNAVRRVTTEWEMVILNGLSKCGTAIYEPKVPGTSKIDVLFKHDADTALIEITTVSDRGLDEENPVELLSDQLVKRVREYGLNPGHFGLRVGGNWRDLFLGGPKPRLLIPHLHEFDSLIFNQHFYQFLDAARSSATKSAFSPYPSRPQMLTITYDPAQRFYSLSHLAYTTAFTVEQNPIYNRLSRKEEQLDKASFPGVKGVILCDGGCSALWGRKQSGLNLDADDIIRVFLKRSKSVAFVLTVLVKPKRSGPLNSHSFEIIVNTYLSSRHPMAGPVLKYLRDNLAASLPEPETSPLNAYSLDNEGKSSYGGGTMSGKVIKMSVRSVLGLLAGRIKQETFIRDYDRLAQQHARDMLQFRGILDAHLHVEKDELRSIMSP
jgi:hypothetical protein